MECIQCENCKTGSIAYFCVAKNDFVIPVQELPQERTRGGWKKGVKEYEIHRRKARKEVEV